MERAGCGQRWCSHTHWAVRGLKPRPQSGSSTMNTPLKYIKTLRWEALNMVKMSSQTLSGNGCISVQRYQPLILTSTKSSQGKNPGVSPWPTEQGTGCVWRESFTMSSDPAPTVLHLPPCPGLSHNDHFPFCSQVSWGVLEKSGSLSCLIEALCHNYNTPVALLQQ